MLEQNFLKEISSLCENYNGAETSMDSFLLLSMKQSYFVKMNKRKKQPKNGLI